MKVLFLDIDGVLNHQKHYEEFNLNPANRGKYTIFRHFNKKSIDLLNKLLNETGAGIVLSSSWRLDPKIDKIFIEVGIKHPIYSKTPCLSSRIRGEEIKSWLDNHLEVDKYCILDDDSDFLDYQLPNFVQTNTYSDGFNESCYNQCLNILK